MSLYLPRDLTRLFEESFYFVPDVSLETTHVILAKCCKSKCCTALALVLVNALAHKTVFTTDHYIVQITSAIQGLLQHLT